MKRRAAFLVLLALLTANVTGAVVAADEPAGGSVAAPGEPVDYAPLAFYPERWTERNQSAALVPWTGEEIVLLTTSADFDREVMAVFLKRLDGGWKRYRSLVGRSPRPGRRLNGKPTIAAVPDARLTCGAGCGFVGATGIEVSYFYRSDYKTVAKNRDAFPHYFFYEMGRNYFVFGDRHSSFTTGFAVFMRYVCMDALNCEDPDARTREAIEKAEALYAQSDLDFLKAFTTNHGLTEKQPRLTGVAGPSDQPVMYASAMLKLRREHGGDDWVKAFFKNLAACPTIAANQEDYALKQSLSWLIAASLAAKKDLTETFVDRWRFPMGPKTRRAFGAIDWASAALTPTAVLERLPADPRT